MAHYMLSVHSVEGADREPMTIGASRRDWSGRVGERETGIEPATSTLGRSHSDR